MGVYLGRRELGMTEHLLDEAHVRAILQHERRHSMGHCRTVLSWSPQLDLRFLEWPPGVHSLCLPHRQPSAHGAPYCETSTRTLPWLRHLRGR